MGIVRVAYIHTTTEAWSYIGTTVWLYIPIKTQGMESHKNHMLRFCPDDDTFIGERSVKFRFQALHTALRDISREKL